MVTADRWADKVVGVARLTYLQLTDPGQHRASSTQANIAMVPVAGQAVRDLTTSVGQGYGWPSQNWDDQRWAEYLDDTTRQHWAGENEGQLIGLLSLDLTRFPDVEIESFGLAPEFLGRGLGGALLSASVEVIWELGAERIWLHTSTDAHPHAVANYEARGFTRYQPNEEHPDFRG